MAGATVYPVSRLSANNADFCFLSSEYGEPGTREHQPCTIFKVDKKRIASTFTVLADMLEIGQASDEQETFDGLPVVKLEESCQTVESLVQLAANDSTQLPDLSKISSLDLVDAYSASVKYDGAVAGLVFQAEIRLRLPKMGPQDSLTCMGHAERFGRTVLVKDIMNSVLRFNLVPHLGFAATVLTAFTLAQLTERYIVLIRGGCQTGFDNVTNMIQMLDWEYPDPGELRIPLLDLQYSLDNMRRGVNPP